MRGKGAGDQDIRRDQAGIQHKHSRLDENFGQREITAGLLCMAQVSCRPPGEEELQRGAAAVSDGKSIYTQNSPEGKCDDDRGSVKAGLIKSGHKKTALSVEKGGIYSGASREQS